MFNIIARSVAIGAFAVAAILGGVLGASGIASASPEEGHSYWEDDESHSSLPDPEVSPGSPRWPSLIADVDDDPYGLKQYLREQRLPAGIVAPMF